MIAEGSIPNLLLSGVQGTGKTTLARILISEMEVDQSVDVLTINASDLNSVDVIRNDIKDHIQSFAMGKFKIIHLEEADYLTLNAQAVLRGFMEDFADTARFVLTCNYQHKIMPAIRSRCQEYEFKAPSKDDIELRMTGILQSERISDVKNLMPMFIDLGYPDIRKIIQLLQENASNGELLPPTTEISGDYKFQLLDLLAEDSWVNIRKLLCSSVGTDEWEDLYRFLYVNLDKSLKFKKEIAYENGIVIIADHLYKHGICADPEINAAAMLIRLNQVTSS